MVQRSLTGPHEHEGEVYGGLSHIDLDIRHVISELLPVDVRGSTLQLRRELLCSQLGGLCSLAGQQQLGTLRRHTGQGSKACQRVRAHALAVCTGKGGKVLLQHPAAHSPHEGIDTGLHTTAHRTGKQL